MKKETITEKPEDINALVAQIAIATASQTSKTEIPPASNVELTNKVVDTLFNNKKRKLLGILTKKQISGIKKLYILNEIIFKSKTSVLTRIIDNEIDLSVSEKGIGRDQLVKLTKVDDPLEHAGRFSEFLKR